MGKLSKIFFRMDEQSQFFVDFANQSRESRLTRLDFAAREFPIAGHFLARASLGHKPFAVEVDQARRYFHLSPIYSKSAATVRNGKTRVSRTHSLPSRN